MCEYKIQGRLDTLKYLFENKVWGILFGLTGENFYMRSFVTLHVSKRYYYYYYYYYYCNRTK